MRALRLLVTAAFVAACGPDPRPVIATVSTRWIQPIAADLLVRSLAFDPAGDLVLAAETFDPSSGTGSRSIWLDKRAGKTGAGVWQKAIAGAPTGGSAYMPHVATDPAGGIVATGLFGGSVDFGGSLRSANGAAFVAKYDPDGNLLWASDVGPNSESCGLGIAAGKDGRVYAAGNCAAGAPLVVGPTSVACEGSFVASFEGDGTPRWIFTYPSATDAGAWWPTVLPAPDGHFFLIAEIVDGESSDGFAGRFTSDGELDWQIAATQAGAAIDRAGNLLLAQGSTIDVIDATATHRHHFDTMGSYATLAVAGSDTIVATTDESFDAYSHDGEAAASPWFFDPAVTGIRHLATSTSGAIAATGDPAPGGQPSAPYIAVLAPASTD